MVDRDYLEDVSARERGSVRNLTFGMLIFRCIFILVLAIIIMSGVAQELVAFLVNKILEVLN